MQQHIVLLLSEILKLVILLAYLALKSALQKIGNDNVNSFPPLQLLIATTAASTLLFRRFAKTYSYYTLSEKSYAHLAYYHLLFSITQILGMRASQFA